MSRTSGLLLSVALLVATFVGVPKGGADAVIELPTGFQEQIVFSGLTRPTNIEFSPDGRVFVAEQSGRIKVYDSLSDPTPTLFADLSTQVFNNWDRGLLGMALHPQFPAEPWVYVLYTRNAPPGQTAPYWPDDSCESVGGENAARCVVTSRLSRLQANGNVMTGSEQVLIGGDNWCQQFPSHSTGDLAFGSDGMLYVSSGDGASFSNSDRGQYGTPTPNPCADPENEGGALRSQDVRSDADPAGLDGTILRLNPATGAAALGNPLIGSPDLNKRRVVGFGLRNPYRMTFRPGTTDLWIGDVGWGTWEEINHISNPLATPRNFGWPCYEGDGVSAAYEDFESPLCTSLYPPGGDEQTEPYYTYEHRTKILAESCDEWGGSSTTGLAFYPAGGGPYPDSYDGALFFADYSRGCIYAMLPATPGGMPSPASIIAFGMMASSPVDLEIGPGNELYYVDHNGTVRRIRYYETNQPPVAVINATPADGNAPLTVHFDGSQSHDADAADAGELIYQWDFTNNGSFDATGAQVSHTYNGSQTYTARLRVTDGLGAFGEATIQIQATGFAPTAFIDTPTLGTDWAVGDPIGFSGHGTDPETPAAELDMSWELRIMHCETETSCHTHVAPLGTNPSGSFTAPEHEYPSHLVLALTVTDGDGQSTTLTRQINPRTVTLNLDSVPSGIPLTVGSRTITTPFAMEVIEGSTNSISAPATASVGGTDYTFDNWSDGGARAHEVIAGGNGSYVATFGSGNGDEPLAVIDSPSSGTKWDAGDVINFSGHGVDDETASGDLELSWTLRVRQCPRPTTCYTDTTPIGTGASGSFAAPDVAFAEYLEIVLTVTDEDDQVATAVRRLNPNLVTLTFTSTPTALPLVVGSAGHMSIAPFAVAVVRDSTVDLAAPEFAAFDGRIYSWLSWSDRGARAHDVTASESVSFRATYVRCGGWYRFIRPQACKLAPRIPLRPGTGTGTGGVPSRTS